MSTTNWTLRLLERDLSKNEVVKDVIAEAKQIDKIAAKVEQHRNEHARMVKRHKEEVTAMNKLLVEIQQGCKHQFKTHHADPSGGSDSSNVCDICGRDDYREPYRHS